MRSSVWSGGGEGGGDRGRGKSQCKPQPSLLSDPAPWASVRRREKQRSALCPLPFALAPWSFSLFHLCISWVHVQSWRTSHEAATVTQLWWPLQAGGHSLAFSSSPTRQGVGTPSFSKRWSFLNCSKVTPLKSIAKLGVFSPWGHKESDTTEPLSVHAV